MKAKLKFLGAARTVTGSKFLLSYKDFNLLIDCGLYQGGDSELNETQLKEMDPASIDAIILTHAHLDHSGLIPYFVKNGFSGKVFSSKITREITKVILADAAKIAQNNLKEINQYIPKKKHQKKVLYDLADVTYSMKSFSDMDLLTPYDIGPFKIKCYPAGHIPGAVSVGVHYENGSVLFSGDLGRFNNSMTFDPAVEGSFDYVVMESTYGGEQHPKIKSKDELKYFIEMAHQSEGIFLIPAFSLSRTQFLINLLYELYQEHTKFYLPIYVDSPMAITITDIISQYPESIKFDLKKILKSFSKLHLLREPWEEKRVKEKNEPCIIISASGMLTGGKVLSHLENIALDKNSKVLLTGFQAEGTQGRRLVQGYKNVNFKDYQVEIKSEILTAKSFSAHADEDELVRWLSMIQPINKEIVLVHGEEEKSVALKRRLSKVYPNKNIRIPILNEVMELN